LGRKRQRVRVKIMTDKRKTMTMMKQRIDQKLITISRSGKRGYTVAKTKRRVDPKKVYAMQEKQKECERQSETIPPPGDPFTKCVGSSVN